MRWPRGVRLLVALADYRSLIGNDVYPDDAFYYLRIAQNLVAGRGMTFDGAAPTNGFQPLYLLMVVPVVALARGSVALPIHLSGVLLTGWAVGTAFVLRALLARLAGRGVALFGVLLWAISPYFILMSVNGLETGVALFFTLALPLAYCAWIRGERAPDAKRALAFGGLAGLAILARLDLALLLAAIAIDWLIRERARVWRAGRAGALTLAGALAVWLPWGIASHAATGHWLPASGSASREIALEWGWLNLQPIWTLITPDRALFDPRHVPAAYHLDVATKLGCGLPVREPAARAPARQRDGRTLGRPRRLLSLSAAGREPVPRDRPRAGVGGGACRGVATDMPGRRPTRRSPTRRARSRGASWRSTSCSSRSATRGTRRPTGTSTAI